jgi:hypothetical protein
MTANNNSIGSIATFIAESFNNIPAGVSGNLIEIVDMSRQHVANYVGYDIGSNSIAPKYQPAIISFAKADVIDFVNAQAGGESISLAELSIDDKGEQMSAEQWRMLGELQLKALGARIYFARSIS